MFVLTLPCRKSISAEFKCFVKKLACASLTSAKRIKKKIISGEISYHKARALLPLVGDVSTTVDTSRSNRYFFELQGLAEEIEKGARGGLRTVDGIEKAVDLIQLG